MIGKTTNLLQKPFVFLSTWRSLPPYEMLSYVLMYASVPMLTVGIQQYTFDIIRIIIFTILTLYCGFFAALIWNDITDSDIDTVVHPDRPIPSGRISSRKFFIVALIFSALTFLFSILVSYICFFLVGFAALFVTFHNKYLKKKVKFPAYSEIFTPLQWIVVVLFGFSAIWSVIPQSSDIVIDLSIIGKLSFDTVSLQTLFILVLFTYFADNAHDIAEGIHDVIGDRRLGVRTYATSFGERNAAIISCIWFFLSGIFAFILVIQSIVSLIFLVLFSIIWLYTLTLSIRLLRSKPEELRMLSSMVGRKGFNYLLFSYNILFIDIFLQLLFNYFGISFPFPL